MPPREWRFRIEDILDSIAKIKTYISAMSLEEFEQDSKTIDALVRNFEIIGEAAKHVPADIKKRYSEVPWREMQDFRNMAIHDYHGVNPDVV